MRWEHLPGSFDKARKKEVYRRLARLVRGRGRHELLPLDEIRDRLHVFEQRYIGIEPILVADIVGTASRSTEFDKDFLPLRDDIRQRWRHLEKTFEATGFPPILVYELRGKYFVIDGHHRVAIAKASKMEYIDAEVTELRTSFDIPPDADVGRLILAEQQHVFLSQSGLERARPEAVIDFTRPTSYVQLLEIVKAYGYDLMAERKALLSAEEIAGNWYDEVYLPTVEAIRDQRLDRAFPRHTQADLWLWVYDRRRALFPECGPLELEDVVAKTKEESGKALGRIKPPSPARLGARRA